MGELMAKAKAKAKSKSAEIDTDADLLEEMRERYQKCSEADKINRERALDDMNFVYVPGSQWDASVRVERGKRPMYTFNKLRVTIKRVVNDMRANRPSGKVHGNEDGDKDTAEIYEGLIRNIWNSSDADTVIDQAAEYQVGAGMGAWRVETELPEDEVDNQIIKIMPFKNPLCVYADHHCQDSMKRDAKFWFVTSMMAKDVFEETYPDAEVSSFDLALFDNKDVWITDDEVRVCEYWYKKPVTRKLLKLKSGKILDASDYDPAVLAQLAPTVAATRDAPGFEIWMCICSGTEILEKPVKWAGRQFPFVMVYGEHIVVDGKTEWYGLTRWSKDAQKAYNFTRTSIIETIAQAPQAKYWATPAQAIGLQTSWAEAHKQNLPVMFYNNDPAAPGPPPRIGGVDVPIALMQEAALSSEDIKATSGIFDNSLGKQGNESSGVAIRSRAMQGEIATYNYQDNLTKGVQRTWEILIDLIPNIYDAERTIRVLGQDGAERFARINAQQVGPMGAVVTDPITGKPVLLNDITSGRYDVTVTSGPSFSTQRQEAAETYTALAQANPNLFPLIGDLIFKATDLPYAEQIADRMKRMLPPPLQDQPGQDGKPLPPEAQQAMQQAAMAMQQVQQATDELQQHAAVLEDQKAELTAQANDLTVQKAQLDAAYQKYLGQISQKEAQLQEAEAQAAMDLNRQSHENDRAALAAEVQKAMADIQAQAAGFMEQVAQHVATVHASNGPPVVNVAPAAKRRIVSMERVNGKLVGQVLDVPDEPVSQVPPVVN